MRPKSHKQQLIDILVAPLVTATPDATTALEWLEYAFGVDTRDQVAFIAREEFEMPGSYYMTPTRPVGGLIIPASKRRVGVGASVFVRTDSRMYPNVADVEVIRRRGDSDCFRVTEEELEGIMRKLEAA